MYIAIFILLMGICSYLYNRSIFHPAVVANGIWGTIILLYNNLNHPLWCLSDAFYIAILCWLLPFTLLSNFIGNIPIKHKTYKQFGNIRFYNKLMPFILVLGFLSICGFIMYSKGSMQLIRLLLTDQEFPFYIKIILYLSTFLIVYFLWGIINIEHINKKSIVFLLVVLLIISIFKSNKTSFLSLFVSIAYIFYYKRNLSIKKIVISSAVLIVFLIIVSSSRADYDFESSSGLENYLYIYLFSPLTAFDLLLNQEINLGVPATGESILIFFYKIFNVFGANIDFSTLGVWVDVPLPTNVYTVMRIFFLEGGFVGILIGSVIMGIIWGVLFRMQKTRNPIIAVFYATMLPSLFFQSFGDYFFYSFSMTLQYLLFSIIIGRGIKLPALPKFKFRIYQNYNRTKFMS